MAYQFHKIEKEEGVTIVYFNRPPVNAISMELMLELDKILKEIEDDNNIRAVILTSAIDKYFMAGADLTPKAGAPTEGPLEPRKLIEQTLKDLLTEEGRKNGWEVHRIMRRLQDLPKPTIAAINGHAVGGGCEMALCCDLRFMARGRGKIGVSESGLGLIPAGGGTQRLPRLIGWSKALELMYEARRLTADEAQEIGLVNRVYEPEKLMEETLTYARNLAQGAAVALKAIKKCVHKGIETTLSKGIEMEMEVMGEVATSQDAVEGIIAFLEKRKPNFSGK